MTDAISPHARLRMQEMLVSETEVYDTVAHPTVDLPDRHHADRRIAVKDRLRVVYAPHAEGRTICTVMWQGAESRAAGPVITTPKPKPIVKEPAMANVEPPTTKAPKLDSVGGRVLAYYRGQPGMTFKSGPVAEAIGADLDQVRTAVTVLARGGHLERVGTGEYRWRRWGESDAAKAQAQQDLAWVLDPANRPPPVVPGSTRPRRKPPVKADPLERLDAIQARINGNGATPDRPPAPSTPPATVAGGPDEASLDDTIDTALDLLVPGGIRARHLALAQRWTALTRELLEATRS